MMNVLILTLLAASALFAADDQQLALTLKAETDFDRVSLAPAPSLRDSGACIQSEAALLPVTTPEDLPLVHFRKGYCTLGEAAITGEAGTFRDAAAEFHQSIETWPGRAAVLAKRKMPPEPVSSGVRILEQVALLKTGNDSNAAKELIAAVEAQSCPGSVMPVALCRQVVDTGREWLGYMALNRGELVDAARDFPATASGWTAWVAGQQAFRDRKYPDAVSAYRRALEAWNARPAGPQRPLLERIAPPVNLELAYTDLGGAQFAAGHTAGALATLNQAVKESPDNARALFLRARAEETAGRREAALADYSLASRTAFANAKDMASGEAHLYRGILLYRRKAYSQAEDEFSSALNFAIPADQRADAVAWRRLAAVEEGSCETGPRYLEEALAAVSPYFPKAEARDAVAACNSTAARR